jgi:LEA14-like dessication related protein
MGRFLSDKIIISAFLFFFTVAGCAGVGQRLEPPRVKLAAIRVAEFNVLETVFEVSLRVFNTNDNALQIKGVECELKINDQPFALGVSDTDVEIPSYGTQLVPLNVYASVLDIIKSARGMQDQDQINYQIKGKVRLGAGGFPALLPFESEGKITLPDLPEIKKRHQFSKPF